jgi:hypothetical protein
MGTTIPFGGPLGVPHSPEALPPAWGSEFKLIFRHAVSQFRIDQSHSFGRSIRSQIRSSTPMPLNAREVRCWHRGGGQDESLVDWR